MVTVATDHVGAEWGGGVGAGRVNSRIPGISVLR